MSQKKERLIKMKEVMERTALSRATLYRLMNADEFPKGIKLCSSAVAWPESEVDKWIADRIKAAKQVK